jgi:hypothetical protein
MSSNPLKKQRTDKKKQETKSHVIDIDLIFQTNGLNILQYIGNGYDLLNILRAIIQSRDNLMMINRLDSINPLLNMNRQERIDFLRTGGLTILSDSNRYDYMNAEKLLLSMAETSSFMMHWIRRIKNILFSKYEIESKLITYSGTAPSSSSSVSAPSSSTSVSASSSSSSVSASSSSCNPTLALSSSRFYNSKTNLPNNMVYISVLLRIVFFLKIVCRKCNTYNHPLIKNSVSGNYLNGMISKYGDFCITCIYDFVPNENSDLLRIRNRIFTPQRFIKYLKRFIPGLTFTRFERMIREKVGIHNINFKYNVSYTLNGRKIPLSVIVPHDHRSESRCGYTKCLFFVSVHMIKLLIDIFNISDTNKTFLLEHF